MNRFLVRLALGMFVSPWDKTLLFVADNVPFRVAIERNNNNKKYRHVRFKFKVLIKLSYQHPRRFNMKVSLGAFRLLQRVKMPCDDKHPLSP